MERQQKKIKDLENELHYALREIDNLNDRLKIEREIGYRNGYSAGHLEGTKQLREYMQLEVRPIHITIEKEGIKNNEELSKICGHKEQRGND
jgi:hypothetical protein